MPESQTAKIALKLSLGPEKGGCCFCQSREGHRLRKRSPGRSKGHYGRVDERGCQGAKQDEGSLSIAGYPPVCGRCRQRSRCSKIQGLSGLVRACHSNKPTQAAGHAERARAGFLSLHIAPSEEDGLAVLEELFIKRDGRAADQVKLAAADGYRRLLAPSMENETFAAARVHSEEKAIEIFSENLRQVLLDPPLGQKCVLEVDPGFRTGCKLALIDRLGRLQGAV
jgi:hypothetical protein